MFFLFSFIIIAYMTYVAAREGSDIALRKSFLLVALLAPTWLTFNVRSIRLDLRIVQAIVAVALLVISPPRRRLVFTFCVTDAVVIGLVVVMSISQYLCGALAPLTSFDIAFTWLATYFIGRLFLQSQEDLEKLAPMAARVLMFVCTLAVLEALTKHNLLNMLMGKTFGILETGEGYRWGLKRSQGNASHPIYNGFQLILFLPIAAYLFQWGWSQTRRNWLAILSPIGLGLAVLVTVSRGAQVGFVIAGMTVVFLMCRPLRIPLAVTALVLGTTLYTFRDSVMESLGRMAGEHNNEVRMLMIDGEEVEYTGTKHRLLLLQVYREPLAEAGWFGWGGALKGVEIDDGLQRFRSIDSHYILFFLQYGWLGLGFFIAVTLLVIMNSLYMSWNDSDLQPVAAGLAAGFVALAVSMTSVWFAPDYAAVWLFNAGLTCNARAIWKCKPAPPVYRLKRHLLPVTQLRQGVC